MCGTCYQVMSVNSSQGGQRTLTFRRLEVSILMLSTFACPRPYCQHQHEGGLVLLEIELVQGQQAVHVLDLKKPHSSAGTLFGCIEPWHTGASKSLSSIRPFSSVHGLGVNIDSAVSCERGTPVPCSHESQNALAALSGTRGSPLSTATVGRLIDNLLKPGCRQRQALLSIHEEKSLALRFVFVN